MISFNVVASTSEDTVVATYEPSKVRSDSYQSEAELEKEFIRLLCPNFIFMKCQHPLIAQAAQLHRQSTSIHSKIIS